MLDCSTHKRLHTCWNNGCLNKCRRARLSRDAIGFPQGISPRPGGSVPYRRDTGQDVGLDRSSNRTARPWPAARPAVGTPSTSERGPHRPENLDRERVAARCQVTSIPLALPMMSVSPERASRLAFPPKCPERDCGMSPLCGSVLVGHGFWLAAESNCGLTLETTGNGCQLEAVSDVSA